MTFEDLLLSKERNRKKKKYFPDHWIIRGFKPEKAYELAKKFFENIITDSEKQLLSVCTQMSTDFWLIRGYSEDEAKEKVSIVQSKNSKKRHAKPIENRKHEFNTCIEYYTKRGMSIEEAKIALIDRQATFSLEKCIERYGEDLGNIEFEKRQTKWQETLNSKSDEEKEEINKKRNIFCLDNLIRIHGEEKGKIEYEKNMVHARSLGSSSKTSKSKESRRFFAYNRKYMQRIKY